MLLKFKRISPGAIAPTRAYPTDSGLDVYAYLFEEESIKLRPGERAVVPTGLAFILPKSEDPNFTYELQVRPRSGIAAKLGVTVLNAPGTIDNSYIGQVKVILINHDSVPVIIKHGEKIAQLVCQRVELPELVEVDDLGESDRASNGFGSTGV